jgi:E3 ubiquitin-protein ligase RNF14
VQLQAPHQLVSSHDLDHPAGLSYLASQTIPEVTALPPVVLGVQLPSTYPSVELPHIVSITSLHSWLPRDHSLRESLAALWYEGEGVLCSWIEYIESARFLEEAGLLELAKSVIRLGHEAPSLVPETDSVRRLPNISPDLVGRLQEWDKDRKTESFERTSYVCMVCLSSVKGSHCIALSCSHVFCRECLEDYWRILIVEGDVVRVGCPDPECLKMRHKAKAEEVRMVVVDGEFERWKRLTEKAAARSGLFSLRTICWFTTDSLLTDPTVVYCPLQDCQTPASGPAPDDPAMVGSDLVRVCPKCNFSFFSFCLRSWCVMFLSHF